MNMDWGNFYGTSYEIDNYLENLYNHRVMFKEILKDGPEKILEVGIGSGSMSIFLSHLGFDVVGVDNDKVVLEKSRKLNKEYNGTAEFNYADAFKLNDYFERNDFDVVFSQGFFEHFSDVQIKNLISEQLHIAKTVIFSVPSNFYPKKDLGNERLLSVKEWENILANFNVSFVKYYEERFISHRDVFKTTLRSLKRPIVWKPFFILAKIKSFD